MSALAQFSRLEVFRLLARSSREGIGVTAGCVSEQLGIPTMRLSFHLKELTSVGLVRHQRNGRSMLYSLDIESVNDLLSYLIEDCCNGKPEMYQPKVGQRKLTAGCTDTACVEACSFLSLGETS